MLYIDTKYAEQLSHRLRNFKKNKDYLWNFSCPICGDSARNKLKARGYIYRRENDLFVKCHNCSYGANLGNFLKEVDKRLYDLYVVERYSSNASKHISHKTPDFFDSFKTTMKKNILLTGANKVSDLEDSHPIKKYVLKRQIPSRFYSEIYWVNAFKKWINEHVTPKFASTADDHPRLVFPFIDENNNLIAVQGRSFGKEKPKYYTIKTDETNEKIYGLNRLNTNERIYAVEGPIDSLFIPNCIAVAGASFDIPFIFNSKNNITIVPDNEPRNIEICKQINKLILTNHSVCLFPSNIKGKDLNEMVLNNPKIKDDLIEIINKNTYTGLEAQMAFKSWVKCKI
ncbi:hypothetical protein EBU71_00035 [bacterium]|nr:hypothetical protein [Candidatus Elulimicrobium humile]